MSRVSFLQYKTTSHTFRIIDGFRFKPKGRFQFLQRWCWALLHRLKALDEAFDQKDEVTRVDFESQDLIRALFEQRYTVMGHFDHRATTLLIGAPDFEQLLSQPEIHQFFSFDAKVGYGCEIMGLKVKVVPWMRGMVVL